MPKQSAGLLLFRENGGQLEVLLVHPGGPFWAKKDDGAWSIPKGEFTAEENPLAAARREFEEELGVGIDGDFIPLGTVKQSGGKTVHAWAVRGDFDPAQVKSSPFSMEWPPRSGRQREFPEVDKAEWFPVEVARTKILKGQSGLIDRLLEQDRR
jgi:predicted NUDIX family NTP pyrophosphohydrolase